MAETRSVNPWTWQEQYVFSQALDVRGAQRLLYCAGQTSVDAEGHPMHKGDMSAQMGLALDNLETILRQAGLTLADVVSVTGYLVDMADFARYNEIYREYFTTLPLPTRSTVAVSALARGARIEMTMTAVRSK